MTDRTHTSVFEAILTLILCLVCTVNTHSQPDRVRSTMRVGPNIQVSKDRADVPHTEVILTADPADPKRLLAGLMLRYEGSEDQCIGYLSTDGGVSWKPVLEPGGRAETRGAGDLSPGRFRQE